jgi:hypothetical protein
MFETTSPEGVEDPGSGLIQLHPTLPTEYLKDAFSNKNYRWGSGALFVAHKNNIVRHSKEFWIDLNSHLQETNPAAGYGLEKLWRFLLDDEFF